MSGVTEKECKLIVSGIKKVCEEKHIGVNQRFKNMEEHVKSINNKFNFIMAMIIIEIIVVVALKIIKI